MRILMLNYEFPPLGGGASPVSYEIAKGYVKLGHKVDVVTMHYRGLPYFEKKDGIKIYRVKCLRSKKEICHPWEQLTYIISAKRFLKKHLKSNKYDINHTHFIIPTGIISLWLKKKYDLDYIVTSHGSDVLGYNKRFKFLYPLFLKKWTEIIKEAKIVTTPSEYLQNKIKERTKGGEFIVIPNGIDKNKFKPLKKEKRILVVVRLLPNKGVQNILDALKGLDLKEWKVDIVGEGPYRKFLENKVKENNLQSIVKFHGWLDNNSKQIREFYGKASIFISASWFESFGLTILEALSARCYPIVSDIDGHREILNNQGMLFKLKNPEDLKNKLRKIINLGIKTPRGPKYYYWNYIIKKYEDVLR
jgi:glycosyltransferase involved in cell wall biosynthesis